MNRFKVFAGVVALGVGGIASAQINTIGPFTGSLQEGWESVPSFSCPPCFMACITDIFGGAADICDAGGGSGMSITSGWSFQCQILPNSGVRLFGSAGGPAEIRFDATVTKFGGYMGDNGMQGAGTAEFFDDTGAPIGAPQPLSLDGCTWRWNGWESTGPAIKSVKLTGGTFGGFVMLDDLEAEGGQPCYPDCNNSGTLTIADFICFQAEYVAGNIAYADCNNSGGLTIADFICFQAAYVAGCP